MSHAALAEPEFTASMLDMLMVRWQSVPCPETPSRPSPADAMERARGIIVQTVGHYVDYLEPTDQALYDRLTTLAKPESLRELLFQCFDLMVRTRGPAVAVLRAHEIHRLVR